MPWRNRTHEDAGLGRAGIWDQRHRLLWTMMRQADERHQETAIVDATQGRAFGGGEATGDRRKKGTK
jgi:hypothetical protein